MATTNYPHISAACAEGVRRIVGEATPANYRFRAWLWAANTRLVRRGFTLLTVADPAWDVLYEGGVNPRHAAEMAVNEHGLNTLEAALTAAG